MKIPGSIFPPLNTGTCKNARIRSLLSAGIHLSQMKCHWKIEFRTTLNAFNCGIKFTLVLNEK